MFLDQAFLRSYDSLLSCQNVVSLSQSFCVSPVELTDERGGGRGWARSQIKRLRESLALYINSLLSGVRYFVPSLSVSPIVRVRYYVCHIVLFRLFI
jgi:hypothetical protein